MTSNRTFQANPLLVALVLLGLQAATWGRIITTVAGGDIGDGDPSPQVSLTHPSGVALDNAGHLYIANEGDNRILRVDRSTGSITLVAGNGEEGDAGDGGPATEAQLNPTDVAVDAAGNIYIADPANHRVRRVDGATGIISTVAGTGVWGDAGDGDLASKARLKWPNGVALDKTGHLYIADTNNARIRRVDAHTGVITTVAGSGTRGMAGDSGPAREAQLRRPADVVVAANGDLYIADTGNHRIRRVDAVTGLISTIAGTGQFLVDGGFAGDGDPAKQAQLHTPSGVAIDEAGHLYIADTGNHRIRQVDSASGLIATFAGTGESGYIGEGGTARQALLNRPERVVVDEVGNLYIVDRDNHRIRRVGTVEVSPGYLHFGTVALQANKTLKFTLANRGYHPVAVQGIRASSGDFVVSPSAFTIAATDDREVLVTFTPTTVQGQVAALTIEWTDPMQPPLTVDLFANVRGLADTAWPMRGRDARHTGQSSYVGPDAARLLWRFETGGAVSSSPAIGIDGTIYVGSSDHHVYALMPDGTLKWGFQTESEITSSPALGRDGTIYIGSQDRHVYALNPDGTLKWKYRTGDGIWWSSPALGIDDRVYIGSSDGYLYALLPDGKLKWGYKIGGNIWSSPAIGSDGTIYIGSDDGHVYALGPDGTLKWKFLTGLYVHSSPAIGSDGTIYIGSGDGHVYALGPDGTLKWKFFMGSWPVESSPAIGSDGTIYIGSLDAKVYALGPDGALKWTYATGAAIRASPVIGADGVVYIGSQDRHIYALGPDGELKWKYQTESGNFSSLAIGSDGALYIGAADHHVYAFGQARMTLSVSSLHFGLVEIGDSESLSFVLSNHSNQTVSVTDISSDTADFTALISAFTLAARTEEQVVVTFTPGSDEAQLATLTIVTTDAHQPQFTVSLSGNTGGLANAPWPMLGRDIQRTGKSPHAGPQEPRLLWRIDTEAHATTSPVIGADGTIYIGTYYLSLPTFGSLDGYVSRVYAFKPNGVRKWSFSTERPNSLSSPALGADGGLYMGVGEQLYALDKDGKLKWNFFAGRRVSSPAIDRDGVIYVGANNGRMFAVLPNGTLKWMYQTEEQKVSSPSLDPDGCVYFAAGAQVFVLSPDGALKWTYPTTDPVVLSPALGVDGTVYLGAGSQVYALASDGEPKWASPINGQVSTAPAVEVDGTVYIGTEAGSVYALTADGAQKWNYQIDSGFVASVIIGGDGIIYSSVLGTDEEDGRVYALNSGGSLLWSFPTGKGEGGALYERVELSPALGANGTLYVGSYGGFDSRVYAIGQVALQPSITHLDFGTVTPPASKTLPLSLANWGTDALLIQDIFASQPDFAVSPTSFTLAPRTSQEITITFTPSTVTAQFAALAIVSDDPYQPELAIQLTAGEAVLGLADAPWPMRGRDVRHTGQSPYNGPDIPQLKWRFELGGWPSSSPIIGADGTLYVTSENKHIYAIMPDGTLKWAFETEGEIISSPAIGGDGTIYVGSEDRYVYALWPDGALKWKYKTGERIPSSPAIGTDGTLYFGTNIGDRKVYALNPDGTLKWTYETGEYVVSSPAIGIDGTIYVGSGDTYLYALKANGKLKWKYKTGGWIQASPAIATDGTIYIGSSDSHLYALDPDGVLMWKYRADGRVRSPSIGADGTIYVLSRFDEYLYALYPDGSLKWRYKAGDGLAPTLGADGTIYISSEKKVVALNPDGILIWQHDTGDWVSSSPVIGADGVLYIMSGLFVQAIGQQGVIAKKGDYDGDGAIGIGDFFKFADHFGTDTNSVHWDPHYDLMPDGVVDFADFFQFADLFAPEAQAKLVALAQGHLGPPTVFGLEPNYPNPFNSSTLIRYTLPRSGTVTLTLYNLTGQRVATLVDGPREAGTNTVAWDGRDGQGQALASGVYLYRLQAGTQVETRKLVLVR